MEFKLSVTFSYFSFVFVPYGTFVSLVFILSRSKEFNRNARRGVNTRKSKMSFVDLATLALLRRTEMEARINVLVNKCDHAINNIVKMKEQAQSFVHQLNCEPTELKERFLGRMNQLDEYIYVITDFNLCISQLDQMGSVDDAPVHDTSSSVMLLPTPVQQPFNIIDALSEPTPSTSTACPNQCPLQRPKRKKRSKQEQMLIQFSSTSTSAESMPIANNETVVKVEETEPEVQCELAEEMKKMALSGQESCKLPAQTMLRIDHVYSAIIMSISGVCFWVITEDPNDAFLLIEEMTDYYKRNHVELSLEEVKSLMYCAFYDNDSDCYYRGLFIGMVEQGEPMVEIFLVDTGEVRFGKVDAVQPLAARFYSHPPFARCCHLAGIDLLSQHNKDVMEKYETFMKQYWVKSCSIEVDDDTSESLGVYVTIEDTKEILNNVLVEQGLAVSIVDKPAAGTSTPKPTQSRPGLATLTDSQLDITNCPEYDDPVEAVTGYKCRDDADICKHYKGGPNTTCFKGARCKKKHILKHPDGWTLDRVEVTAKFKSVPLPAPGTWHKVLVTCVCHFDRLWVHFIQEKGKEEDVLPSFGVVLPPSTLDALVRDMNSPAARMSYKRLQMTPAPGELVAALYPLDDQWYRARVLSATRADQNVEVIYVDYGNVVWVKEDEIRVLEPRYTVLPAQAVRCVLAGVTARSHESRQWAEAKKHLARLAQDQTLDAHVIGRDYDEVTIELYDAEGYSIAEQLAVLNMVTLTEYDVIDDINVKHKQVVP